MEKHKTRPPVRTKYIFECEGDPPVKLSIDIVLDGETLERIRTDETEPPDWALLENSQCESCELDASKCTHCPAAVAMSDLGRDFQDLISYHQAEVTVITEERTTTADTTIQKALRSLLGLYMATSGCPVLAKLKPMARHHLPFATLEETAYRSLSAYLLSQYVLKDRGEDYEFGFKGLVEIYEKIHRINESMSRRFRVESKGDAQTNALVLLDLYTHRMAQIVDNGLSDLVYLFRPYFDSES